MSYMAGRLNVNGITRPWSTVLSRAMLKVIWRECIFIAHNNVHASFAL